MSDLDRLHEIIDALPQQQVQARLALLAPTRPLRGGTCHPRNAVVTDVDNRGHARNWPIANRPQDAILPH